jgi:uncharacterized protein (TIGR01777 family)
MDYHLLALQLMAIQGLLGAFDTLYHHELTEALPQRPSARQELAIHCARAILYSALFIGLAMWEWHGIWTVILVLIFVIEIMLTLWDFIIEDQTRLLPATERVTHTLLAINGGAFICLLALVTPDWFAQESAMVQHHFDWLSYFLIACGIGVGISGIRDGLAAYHLYRNERKCTMEHSLHFAPSGQQVLVTGGTGFIGQELIHALLSDGHHVTVLTRKPKHAAWLFNGKVVCVQSLSEIDAHTKIDLVINLAGARILGWRWSEKRKATLRLSRIALTEQLVAWIKNTKHKPSLFLSASAIGYYGIQAQQDTTSLDEDSPPQAIFMSQLCQEWEAAAQQASNYGVSVACMRFGLVLGQQGALPMMLLPIKLGLGGKLGRGDQWHSWIHIHDLIRGIAHLCQVHESTKTNSKAALETAYNFTAPEALSQLEFSQTAAKLLHRPSFFPTPAWPMRVMMGEQADLLLEGQRVAPKRLLESGFMFDYPSLKEALTSLV